MARHQISPDVARPRARLAALSRSRTPDDPELLDARRELRYAGLAESIQKAVDAAPPLTTQQLNSLARLLAPSVGAA